MTTDPALEGYLGGEGNKGVLNPLNLNLYSYTYNRPATLIDPDGENPGVHYSGYYEGGWVIHDVQSGNWIIDNTVLGILNQAANILPSAYNASRDALIFAGQMGPVLDSASMAAGGVPPVAAGAKGGAIAAKGLGRIMHAPPSVRALPAPPARLALPAPAGRGTTDFVVNATIVHHGKVIGQGTVDLRATVEAIESGRLAPRNIFENRQNRLPPKPAGYYQEFVHPTPPTLGVTGAGPQRIVRGQGGELYYTPDHYFTFIPLNPPRVPISR